MTMGQKMKQLRKEKGLTMEDLATEFNKKYSSKLNKTVISRLENNKLSNNNKYLGYYIDYFGVSYEWLQNDEQTRHTVKNATIQSLMTYENFKKEVNKLDLSYNISYNLISVIVNSEGVCFVDGKRRYGFYFYCEFNQLDENLQKKLFGLVTELAKTPLDERGDLCKEEKWYLKHKYFNTYTGDNYLCQALDTLSLSHKMDGTVLDFQFTEHDIEELKKKININEFVMEKVE